MNIRGDPSELAPENNAKKLILWLMDKYPDKFSIGQTRTLQRRIAQWRQNQTSKEEKLRDLMIHESVPHYILRLHSEVYK